MRCVNKRIFPPGAMNMMVDPCMFMHNMKAVINSCVHLHILTHFKTYTHVPEVRMGSKYIHVYGN
jgi:hypothetical protein